jgi:hypothetical protein
MTPTTSKIHYDSIRPLARARVLGGHRNTVMGISVAHAAARVASIDYDGVWIVRNEGDLEPLATGRMEGRGRGIALSPNGTRVAGLLALHDHSDTRYNYDVFVDDATHPGNVPTPLLGERVTNVAWAPDSEHIVLTGALGFRVHHCKGTNLRTDESPKGWSAARVTVDARRVYFLRHRRLGGLELDTSRELLVPDVSPFAPPDASPGWDADGFALSRGGDLFTMGRYDGRLYVWSLASALPILELRWAGPQIFCTKAVLAPDGARLVASFHHVDTSHSNGRVTHVLFDLGALGARGIVGAIDTHTDLTGFHSKACFSADGRHLYVSEGHRVHVCDVES